MLGFISFSPTFACFAGVRPKIVGSGTPDTGFRIDGPAQHGVPGLIHLWGHWGRCFGVRCGLVYVVRRLIG